MQLTGVLVEFETDAFSLLLYESHVDAAGGLFLLELPLLCSLQFPCVRHSEVQQ